MIDSGLSCTLAGSHLITVSPISQTYTLSIHTKPKTIFNAISLSRFNSVQKSLPWALQQLTSNLITVNTKQDHIVHISTVETPQIAPVFTMNFITSTRAEVWNDEPPPIFMYRISVVWKQTPTNTHFPFYCICKVSWSQTCTFHVKADWLPLSVLQRKKKREVIKQVDQQRSFKKALSGKTPNSTEMGIQHHKSQPWVKWCRQLSKDFVKEGALWFKTQTSLCSRAHTANISALKDIKIES